MAEEVAVIRGVDAMPNVTDTQILTIFKGVIDDASVERLEGDKFKEPDL